MSARKMIHLSMLSKNEDSMMFRHRSQWIGANSLATGVFIFFGCISV